MAEWLECTVARIRALGARRILEVGCGVGLLLEKLAPGSVAYCGTDLSPVAIHRLSQFTARRPALRHVKLLEREAVDFSGLASHSFDAIVLNSVVQYFPSIEYLRDVLEQAVRVVAPGGHIFVGDNTMRYIVRPITAHTIVINGDCGGVGCRCGAGN